MTGPKVSWPKHSMSGETPSRMVGSKKKGARSGRALPPVSTRAPLDTASSTWARTVSSWRWVMSVPMSTSQSREAPRVSACVRATNRSTKRS